MPDKNKYVSARISADRRDRLRTIVLNHELATKERITIDSLIAHAVDFTFPEAK